MHYIIWPSKRPCEIDQMHPKALPTYLEFDNPSGIPGQCPCHNLRHTGEVWPHPAPSCKILQCLKWELKPQMFYQSTCRLMARDHPGWLIGVRPSQRHPHSIGSRATTAEAAVWGLGGSIPFLSNAHRGCCHVLCSWQGSWALRQWQPASLSWAPSLGEN